MRKYEAAIILRAIAESDGDRRAAAQKLNIGLSSLYRKLEELEDQKLLPEDGPSQREARQS
jgi:two-component system response regulator AtoC